LIRKRSRSVRRRAVGKGPKGTSLAAYPTASPVLNGEVAETDRKAPRCDLTKHHRSGKVLAYVFGRRQDEVFLKLKALLEPFGITKYYTDSWGAYTRHIEVDQHRPGKRNTQQIERKHLTLRTRFKRLTRKTICFSKSIQMHDIVIGLFVNRYEFGLML
jgi:insertion element IS1 protein InsB